MSTTLTVIRTEWISSHLIRVYFGGPGFAEFTPSPYTDSYVKLLFGRPEGQVRRTYTVRMVDPVAQEIAIDFVVHGSIGIAGPWAAHAQPGDQLTMLGPNGAYAPHPDADWHLLAGDESALPAISTALAAMPAGTPVVAVLEVADSADEIDFATDAQLAVTWVHRGAPAHLASEDRVGDHAPLIAAVRAVDWRPGQPGVFIHGEAQAVMRNLRAYIRNERGVPARYASISGYWRRGRTEEGFREWKAEFAAALTP